jgi:ribosomal protein S18 acetylase RimI-like enzyme
MNAMPLSIEPYEESTLDAVVALSLRAWAPVFESIEQALDDGVYRHFYGEDWREAQEKAVRSTCAADDIHVWVARQGEPVAGFVAVKLHDEGLGEIYMVAVDPDCQRRGIARALTDHAVAWFEAQGVAVVMVETGGDPGHAPARAAYEAMGFRRFPVARYFRAV